MTTADDIIIVERFFAAIDRLIADKRIRGVKTFTDRYGINRWNFLSLRREPSRQYFEVCWLLYLARDYGVSPSYLLTGLGPFYILNRECPRNVQENVQEND